MLTLASGFDRVSASLLPSGGAAATVLANVERTFAAIAPLAGFKALSGLGDLAGFEALPGFAICALRNTIIRFLLTWMGPTARLPILLARRISRGCGRLAIESWRYG